MTKISVFKSPESRDTVRKFYQGILSSFPFGQSYIDTVYGKTFILNAGTEGQPPVILLHGSCSNSAFWFQELLALSQNYRVYAVDILGEAGNSEEYRPDLRSDAFALWLKEVLDALGQKQAVLLGNSLGGWMALKFAVTFPERVSKLVTIAPSGLSQQNPLFPEKAISASKNDETLVMEPSVLGGVELPKPVLDFINLILSAYNPITEVLPVFTDAKVLRLKMPVLYIAGRDDVMVDTVSAANRLTTLLPQAEVHVLDNTGHMVPNALEFILPFLEKAGTL